MESFGGEGPCWPFGTTGSSDGLHEGLRQPDSGTAADAREGNGISGCFRAFHVASGPPCSPVAFRNTGSLARYALATHPDGAHRNRLELVR